VWILNTPPLLPCGLSEGKSTNPGEAESPHRNMSERSEFSGAAEQALDLYEAFRMKQSGGAQKERKSFG